MGDFTAAASRLAGVVGVLLGWRPDEFWSATPAELAAVTAALKGDAAEGVSTSELDSLRAQFPDGG